MGRLTDRELLAVIGSHRANSFGRTDGDLASQRTEALDRYLGRKYGNEVEGRSQVVSRDLSDTVDWIMPQLMEVFTASGEIARFEPVGPEDEKQAEQEGAYVNHVLMRDNKGWLIFHDWFKDALLSKNGYVKHGWDESDEVTTETYGNLTDEGLALLFAAFDESPDEFEVIGQESEGGQEFLQEDGTPVEDEDGNPVMVGAIHTVKVKRTKNRGREEVEVVPPEEIRVSRRCKGSIKSSPYVEHETVKTRTQLIEMGISKDFVDSLPAYSDDEDSEDNARDTDMDTSEQSVADKSMDEIEYRESYVRVDYDGDGVAELRKVTITGDKIPPVDWANEEIPEIPFADLTPSRMPHRHIGQSINDLMGDLAEIKTTLMRQLLDNIYLTNNQRTAVNENTVNMDDMIISRPGGIVRVDGDPGPSMFPVQTQPILGQILPVLDYVDTVKETRTGVGKNTLGLDPDTLQDATKGAFMEASRKANKKVEMIARMFAETGVKDLILGVHGDLIRYHDEERITRLRNEYVPVKPSDWKERTDITISVGLGNNSQEDLRQNLMLLGGIQEKASQAGIVLPKNVYALAEDMTEALGFKQRGKYFTAPDSPEYQQAAQARAKGEKNQLAEAEQVKGHFDMQKAQMRSQLDAMKEKSSQTIELLKLRRQAQKDRDDKALKVVEMELDALMQGLNFDIGPPGVGNLGS